MDESEVGVEVRLRRFCAKCGLYEVWLIDRRPDRRRVTPEEEREAWLRGQHEKAARLRAVGFQPEPWRCARCGHGEYRLAGQGEPPTTQRSTQRPAERESGPQPQRDA